MGPSGTYGTRWQFLFIGDNGDEYRIELRQKNYTGSAATRPLGRAPILKRESGGAICGTSLEIYAEAASNGEYLALYTSSAREFYVELQRKSGSSWQSLWMGFVTPELYSEPDIAPPYDVQIIATDGLGELKSYQFAKAGRRSLLEHIEACLDNSGLIMTSYDLWAINELHPTGVSASSMLSNVTVDLDAHADESCYDVLSGILRSLNARLTLHNGNWVLLRENDLSYEAAGGGRQRCYNAYGGSEQIPVPSFGTMSYNDFWPIGNLSETIMPAKNRVSTALQYRPRVSMFPDGDCEDADAWTVQGNVTWQTFGRANWVRPYCSVGSGNGIGTNINVSAYGGATTLKIGLCSYGIGSVEVGSKCTARITVRCGSYYLARTENGDCYWASESGHIDYTFDRIAVDRANGLSLNDFTELELPVRYIPATGQFGIEIINYSDTTVQTGPAMFIGWVHLLQDMPFGYRDNLSISNGAREAGDDVELIMGDAPYDGNAIMNIQNVLATSGGTLLSNWLSARHSTQRAFIEAMAVDYALTDAKERWKITGRLNMPSGAVAPILMERSLEIYYVSEFSWDLLNSECEVTLMQRPTAASIVVGTSEIVEVSGSIAQTGSSSGGGGGTGGASTYAALPDKPQINTVELVGSKTSADLGLIGYDTMERVAEGQEVDAVMQVPLTVSEIKYAGESGGNMLKDDDDIVNINSPAGVRLYDANSDRSIEFVSGVLVPVGQVNLGSIFKRWGSVYAEYLYFGGARLFEDEDEMALLAGNEGIRFDDDGTGNEMTYANGSLSSTGNADLGKSDAFWKSLYCGELILGYSGSNVRRIYFNAVNDRIQVRGDLYVDGNLTANILLSSLKDVVAPSSVLAVGKVLTLQYDPDELGYYWTPMPSTGNSLAGLSDVELGTGLTEGTILVLRQARVGSGMTWQNNSEWDFGETNKMLPAEYGTNEIGSPNLPLKDIYVNGIHIEPNCYIDNHSGSSMLRLYGRNAVEIGTVSGGWITYEDGALISDSEDSLGNEDNYWGEVWSPSLTFAKRIVSGSAYKEGIYWLSQYNLIQFNGNISFNGDKFAPTGSHLGQAVQPLLGDGANNRWWYGAFVRHYIVERNADGNHAMSWGSIGAGDVGFTFTDGASFEGDVYCDTLHQSSDASLKENVEDIDAEEAVDILMQLRPVDFDWKRSGDRGHGFIAQDVQKVVPDLVAEKADGKLSMNYTGLIAYLVKVCQDQEVRIAQLEESIEKLMKK